MRILLSYYFGPNAIPLGSSLASALQALAAMPPAQFA